MQLKGTTILKVTGILYIVFAALGILGGLLVIFGGGLLASGGLQTGAYLGAGFGSILAIAGIVTILGNVLGLVTGILGVKYCRRPDKAQICFVLGIVLTVFAAISLISSFGNDSSSIVSGLIGLVLPVLYTLGAYWNKQSAQYQQYEGYQQPYQQPYQQSGYQYSGQQQPPAAGPMDPGATQDPNQKNGPEL